MIAQGAECVQGRLGGVVGVGASSASWLRRRLALAAVVAVVVPGCGGKDRGKAAARPPQPSAEAACTGARERIRQASPGSSNYRGQATASGAVISLTVGDFFFSPTCVTRLTPGSVTLTVKNDSQTVHNVSIPEQRIDQDIPPGQTVQVPVRAGRRPVIYFCKFHEASGMLGEFVPSGRT